MKTTVVDLGQQVGNLSRAVEAASGRVDPAVVDEARRVIAQVDQRLAFSGAMTVVALAGATGSGKSSVFNALSGTQLAEPGVRRPTTSRSMAAYWGDDQPSALLDWLEVPRRHTISGGEDALAGLVLMDLPDHDSTETAHRQEVDRLVKKVDLFVWVLDPEKYADAALHDRYLRPLADHAGVMLVALNKADRLSPEQLAACLADLRRILDAEGLGAAKLLATSAVTGQGIGELRALLTERIGAKQSAAQRLGFDITRAASELAGQVGDAPAAEVSQAHVRQLNRSLAQAGGADLVKDAVLRAVRQRGSLATGWPLVKWIARFRPDPLRRLHLDQFPKVGRKQELEPVRVQRTSLPRGNQVARSRVDSAVRALSDEVTASLPRGWQDAVRRASRSNDDILADELDRAIATTDLAMDRGLGWWQAIRVLQWILTVAVLGGLLWLLADVLLAYFQLPPLPAVQVAGRLPLPTVLAIGGALAGVLLALVSRGFVELSARAKAARAGQVLAGAVAGVTQRMVVDPVDAELARYRTARDALRALT